MASKNARDTQALTDTDKAAPRDRDQSSESPARVHREADKAEFPSSADVLPPELGDGLTSRDNLEDTPDDPEVKSKKP